MKKLSVRKTGLVLLSAALLPLLAATGRLVKLGVPLAVGDESADNGASVVSGFDWSAPGGMYGIDVVAMLVAGALAVASAEAPERRH